MIFQRVSITLFAAISLGAEAPVQDSVTGGVETGRILKRTYEFKAAEQEMEYALFVPNGYDGKKSYPLMIALHGLYSNPKQILSYPGLTKLAQKHGYIVAAPMGYNRSGWYGSRGQTSRRWTPNNLGELSEKDVMNVLAIVRKEFKVDGNRIYLIGHSMGGGGTWHLGLKYPKIWAGLAPIAPAIYRSPSDLPKIKHIPVILVQGDADRLVPVAGARRWAAKMKELGMTYRYLEIKGGGHVKPAFDTLPDIFQFFEKHSKSSGKNTENRDSQRDLDVATIRVEQETQNDSKPNLHWPQFRGEKMNGIVPGKNLPVVWDKKKNVAWSSAIPGKGWSCPVVWGDRVFVTSFVGKGKVVAPRQGFYAPFKTLKPDGKHRWMVYCLDSDTGKIVWAKVAHEGTPEFRIHIKSSYASETPVTDGERVYAYFGNVGLFCYDMQGNLLWTKRWPVVPMRFNWGTGASPVLHGDRIYVINDNEKQSFITALDKVSGKVIWKVERDEKSNWATPYIWGNKLRTEIVTCGTKKVRSYDLNGALLWEFKGMSSICVPAPVAARGLLYINSGYEYGAYRPVYAVRPGAKGDISLNKGETSNKFIAWYHTKSGSYHPSTLVYGDYVYILYSRGFIACFDAKTGKEVYGRQRLEGFFTASPWAQNGKIYCLNENGDTYVIQAGPKFKQLARNSVDEMCLATPAVAGDRIFLRTLTKLYCIEKTK